MEKISNVYFRFFKPRTISDMDYTSFENIFILDSSFIDEKKLWSRYKLQKPIVNAILKKRINIRDKDYILCPLYGTNRTFSDFQVGVTETRKVGESNFEGFKRSIGEELGLRYLKPEEPSGYVDIKYNGNIKSRIFTLNIDKTDMVKPIETPLLDNLLDDDKKLSKSGCVVYGKEEDIVNFLNRDEIILDKSSDDIVGIVGVRFSDVKKQFGIVVKKSSKKSKNYLYPMK